MLAHEKRFLKIFFKIKNFSQFSQPYLFCFGQLLISELESDYDMRKWWSLPDSFGAPPSNHLEGGDVDGQPDSSGKEEVRRDPDDSSHNADQRSARQALSSSFFFEGVQHPESVAVARRQRFEGGGEEGLEGGLTLVWELPPPPPNLLRPPSKCSEGDNMMRRGQSRVEEMNASPSKCLEGDKGPLSLYPCSLMCCRSYLDPT